jgi:2-oxoisovalerate dehydrogenase E2 component (dihydrolipoyl transacylase)
MTSYVFKLPDVGEGIVEAEIVEWYIKPGDTVEVDQAIVDVMTEKAAVEITSPVSGTVVSVAGEAGEQVAVGTELIRFEVSGDVSPPENDAADTARATASDAKVAESKAKPVEETRETPATARSASEYRIVTDKPLASPATRRRARESGADLQQVSGSGHAGRILATDLENFLRSRGSTEGVQGVAPDPASVEIPLRGLRRQIAKRMAQSKRSIPHFTYVEEVDVTELEALRQHLNQEYGGTRGKLSYLPFLMLALCRVLHKFPQCNSTFDEENELITQHGAIHVGIATQTDSGLKVPVVRHAESRALWNASTEMKRVSQAARDSSAKLEELKDSTITITSLGAKGGIVSTPLINAPEVAIVGVNKSVERVVVLNGEMTVRRMMNLSSSFDHRIVDGYDAAAMIQNLKDMLECPATIFI